MANSPAHQFPADININSRITYYKYLGTSTTGTVSYSGWHVIGGCSHPVLIKHRPLVAGFYYAPSREVQAVIDDEPDFVQHLCTYRTPSEVITVREQHLCTLRDIASHPDGFMQLPPWRVVRNCMLLVLRLHRSGFYHNALTLGRFVFMQAGSRLATRLSGFHHATRASDDPAARAAALFDELGQLAGVIE
jgi:hypothetical protein